MLGKYCRTWSVKIKKKRLVLKMYHLLAKAISLGLRVWYSIIVNCVSLYQEIIFYNCQTAPIRK